MKKLGLLIFILLVMNAKAWAAGHWVDVTTAKTTGQDGTAKYMMWSSLVADSTGNVTKLRVSIRSFGSPTEIRLALYRNDGLKLAEGTVVVTQAGYQEISIPLTPVIQGNTYYIAAQAASPKLNKFDCGATTGGFEGPNTYSAGFPQRLPSGWGDKLLTAGMYIE